VLVRTRKDFQASLHRELIDAALVDVGAPNDDTPAVIELARAYPSTPFIAQTPLRSGDASIVGRCAASDFADVAFDGIDDAVLRELVLRRSFSRRFSDALATAPEALRLAATIQLDAWRVLVSFGGRSVQTATLASALRITREHLSRAFAHKDAPNLKRVIDLVRLLAAAELAKSPGYDVGDVARVLEFASSSHLSTTALRIVGTRPTSLARLRAVDMIERFAQGRARSRRPLPRRNPSH
jgi:AraC-like DNA-binding protein